MTAASGWDGAAVSEAARRVRRPSAACSLAARGDDGVFMGAVLKRRNGRSMEIRPTILKMKSRPMRIHMEAKRRLLRSPAGVLMRMKKMTGLMMAMAAQDLSSTK